jgi:hypothetical protein
VNRGIDDVKTSKKLYPALNMKPNTYRKRSRFVGDYMA